MPRTIQGNETHPSPLHQPHYTTSKGLLLPRNGSHLAGDPELKYDTSPGGRPRPGPIWGLTEGDSGVVSKIDELSFSELY